MKRRTGPARRRPERDTVITIRNMVCDRCIRVVREELTRLGLTVRSVRLGEAAVRGRISARRLREVLEANGFGLVENREERLIEAAKRAIIAYVRGGPDAAGGPAGSASAYLEKATGVPYRRLSALFSSVENISIEHAVILQKIEYAKELLKYGEETLSEIAYRLGYSSVQHLSAQFREITGFTASAFKAMAHPPRRALDRVLTRRKV